MRDSELADPYMTPRTAPARRPMNFLIFVLLFAIVLLTVAAATLMVWWSISPSRLMLDRSPPVVPRRPLIQGDRGPVPRIEQSVDFPDTSEPF